MKLDILAFGAHPDDVELSCSGTLIAEATRGKKTGVVDLTEGEMGTRGTVETRYAEAAAASAIMGLSVRENLKLADGFFQNDRDHQLAVIRAIRRYQPEIILCNAVEDRHPDHGRAARLVEESAFLSGLRKVITYDNEQEQEAWRPKYVFHYLQDRYLEPDFVVDISAVHDRKIESIKAYGTQFYNPDLNEPQTYISSAAFLDSIIYRAKMMGKMVGVEFAEGFMSAKKIGIRGFDDIILTET
jgi:N-acetylglucosamine malate deacetylase 1